MLSLNKSGMRLSRSDEDAEELLVMMLEGVNGWNLGSKCPFYWMPLADLENPIKLHHVFLTLNLLFNG